MEAGEHYAPRQTATYDVLVTDNAGQPVEAELSLRLADLRGAAPWPTSRATTLEQAFWRSRGLGVRTSLPLAVSHGSLQPRATARAKGGGGGDEGGLVRSNFADTTFWDPVVRTGKDGKAQVEATLPDNLTTWRMQARGITADTLVGQVNVDIVSTLDLLVRPVLPRFFIVGDEAEIATIVHNNTGTPSPGRGQHHRRRPRRRRRHDAAGQHRGRRAGQGGLAGQGAPRPRGEGADVGQGRRPLRRPRGHPAGLPLLDARGRGHRRAARRARRRARRSSSCPRTFDRDPGRTDRPGRRLAHRRHPGCSDLPGALSLRVRGADRQPLPAERRSPGRRSTRWASTRPELRQKLAEMVGHRPAAALRTSSTTTAAGAGGRPTRATAI